MAAGISPAEAMIVGGFTDFVDVRPGRRRHRVWPRRTIAPQ